MTTVDWYFDYLSPFSYLQTFRFDDLPGDIELRLRPVLFAGLLKHWGHKGPAEIADKRINTFRHVQWMASRLGVPYRMPPAMPFNPLRILRLSVALGGERRAVESIFAAIWQDGLLPDDDAGWAAICDRLGVDDGDAVVADPAVKQGLLDIGDEAVAAGVFGVPTFIHDGNLFWGVDQTDFFIDYLADPGLLGTGEMGRVVTTPYGATR